MREKILDDYRCRACLKKLQAGKAYREVPIYKSFGEDYNKLLDTYKYCIPCADKLGFIPQKDGEDEKGLWSGFEKGIFATAFMKLRFLDAGEARAATRAALQYS